MIMKLVLQNVMIIVLAKMLSLFQKEDLLLVTHLIICILSVIIVSGN